MASSAFYAKNGLTTAAGQTTIDGTTGAISVGANVVIGNTTISVGNATVNVAVSATQILKGNVTINATSVAVGANVFANSTHLAANLAVFTSNVSAGRYVLPSANAFNYISATGANGHLVLQANGTTNVVFVTASGNVGIGTAPSDNFHVQGNIVASGDVTTAYSDIRLKDHLYDLDHVVEKFQQLKGFAYVPSATLLQLDPTQSANIRFGVSAQDVEKVFPELVSLAPFDRAEDGSSKSGQNYLTINYVAIIPVLIEGIKELADRLDNIDTRLLTLQERVDKIERLANGT